MIPSHGFTSNTSEVTEYGASAPPLRCTPSTTKRYSPAGVARSLPMSKGWATKASKWAVQRHSWPPVR